MKSIQLYLQRQGGGESLKIVFVSGFSLRFKKKLVSVILGENPEFILYARAITRPPAMDQAGEQRRIVEARSEDFVDAFVGVQDIAGQLRRPRSLDGGRFRKKREACRIRIAGLGGCRKYKDGPFQVTEREMNWKIRKPAM